MGAVIPLTDATRRPVSFPIITTALIVVNFIAWGIELANGDAFVLKWAATPATIMAGGNWITLLTAMFLHGSWSQHHRQHDLPVGVRPRGGRRDGPPRYLVSMPRTWRR